MKFSFEQEVNFIKKFTKKYFISLSILYVIVLLFSSLGLLTSGMYGIPGGSMSTPLIIIMYIFFGLPLLIGIIYFFRSIYALFIKNWELLKFGLLVIILGFIIGAGVCFSNMVMISI